MSVPSSVNYPVSQDTVSTLFGYQENQTTLTLTAGIIAGDTSITVNETISGLTFPLLFVFTDDGEIVYATSAAGQVLTVERGVANGAAASSHALGATMRLAMFSEYINQLRRAVIAIEGELGNAPSGSYSDVAARFTGLPAYYSAWTTADQSLSGTLTLADSDAPIQYVDPNGAARDVTLPAEASSNHIFIISNTADANETLTVKDDGAATIGRVKQGETKILVSNGTAWKMGTAGPSDTGQIYLSASAMIPRTTGGCAGPTKNESSTHLLNYYSMDFDSATEENCVVSFAMPSDWNGGTITISAYWTAASTDTNGVVFGFKGRALENNDTIDQGWGTEVTVTSSNTATTSQLHVTSASSAMTFAGTSVSSLDLCIINIARKVDNASDTLAVDAQLVGIMITYTRQ